MGGEAKLSSPPRRPTGCYTLAMKFPAGLLSEDDLRAAVDAELESPARQLPPSTVHPALQGRREEVTAWAHARLTSSFLPTPEETVAVSKAGHGVRPVAVWDLPSRLAYGALAERLRRALPGCPCTRTSAGTSRRPPRRAYGPLRICRSASPRA